MAIVGKMSEKALARVLEKKAAEQKRAERNRKKATERREEQELRSRYMDSTPLTGSARGSEELNEVVTALYDKRKEATKQGLTRRNRGRWITHTAQAEAIATAEELAKRGF